MKQRKPYNSRIILKRRKSIYREFVDRLNQKGLSAPFWAKQIGVKRLAVYDFIARGRGIHKGGIVAGKIKKALIEEGLLDEHLLKEVFTLGLRRQSK